MKAKNNVTNLHEPAADEAEVVYCCHEHWNNNPNTLAMHDGRWFHLQPRRGQSRYGARL